MAYSRSSHGRRLSFMFIFYLLASIAWSSVAVDPAWNGHTIPGSTTPAPFTPFFVPPGAKLYDSSSRLIMYSGHWSIVFSSRYINKSLHSTNQVNASVSFTFTGTGIEWFGNCGTDHGVSLVSIDGNPRLAVDAYCEERPRLKQQRIFWDFSLSYGSHTLKIINTATRPASVKPKICDVDAFVVTHGVNPNHRYLSSSSHKSSTSFVANFGANVLASDGPNKWILTQEGTTGVNAMQMAVISSSHAIIVDKVEHNPLTISGHPAWAALYNLKTHAVKPLAMQSNSFCAGGTFLGNGTLINVGGNPVVEDHTSSADFGDVDGLQAIRIFEPCDSDSVEECEIYEHHSRIRMASPRWYNTVLRIDDGSAMVIGGSKKGGWINNATVNNPTIEYFPPKGVHSSNGLPIPLDFLVDTLNSNLFPIAFSLPGGKVFMAANRDAMIYDWKSHQERRLPQIPNNVRVTYPMAGTGLLLPLGPENNFQPEILLCGGSTIRDDIAGHEISSQDPASSQCSRLVLTEEGIAAGWQVESMPQARTMPDAVLLPTGEVLIINGAGSGISGYGNVLNQVGASNAANPVFTPVLYNPLAAPGQRFSSVDIPSSKIPRLYHSVATLTPSGDIMIAGSNPNLDRSEVEYGTEYRVEWLSPPYMGMDRPDIITGLTQLNFGEVAEVKVKVPNGSRGEVRVALMDLGYVTHAVHANSRLVWLKTSLTGDTLAITGPSDGGIYPPGPGWIYFSMDGVPSQGVKVMIGSGASPPIDDAALENLLKNTAVDQYEKDAV